MTDEQKRSSLPDVWDQFPRLPAEGERALAHVGERWRPIFDIMGGAAILFGKSIVAMFRGQIEVKETFRQTYLIGVRSLPLTLLTAVFTGMVFALQFMVALEKFGAAETVGSVVSLAIFRELGPMLTCLMVGSRVASGIAAELGSMQVSEQIDALRALGADPVKKLVVPRLIACTLAMPLLTIIADIIGILGAMAVAWVEYGLGFMYFYSSVLETNQLTDVFSGIIKTVFFGVLIALAGCHQGFQTRGGTEGVGRATTTTVVVVSVAIFIADFILTKALIVVFDR